MGEGEVVGEGVGDGLREGEGLADGDGDGVALADGDGVALAPVNVTLTSALETPNAGKVPAGVAVYRAVPATWAPNTTSPTPSDSVVDGAPLPASDVGLT